MYKGADRSAYSPGPRKTLKEVNPNTTSLASPSGEKPLVRFRLRTLADPSHDPGREWRQKLPCRVFPLALLETLWYLLISHVATRNLAAFHTKRCIFLIDAQLSQLLPFSRLRQPDGHACALPRSFVPSPSSACESRGSMGLSSKRNRNRSLARRLPRKADRDPEGHEGRASSTHYHLARQQR